MSAFRQALYYMLVQCFSCIYRVSASIVTTCFYKHWALGRQVSLIPACLCVFRQAIRCVSTSCGVGLTSVSSHQHTLVWQAPLHRFLQRLALGWQLAQSHLCVFRYDIVLLQSFGIGLTSVSSRQHIFVYCGTIVLLQSLGVGVYKLQLTPNISVYVGKCRNICFCNALALDCQVSAQSCISRISASVVTMCYYNTQRWIDKCQLTSAYHCVFRQTSFNVLLQTLALGRLELAHSNISLFGKPPTTCFYNVWRSVDKCQITSACNRAFWHYTVLPRVLALCWQVSQQSLFFVRNYTLLLQSSGARLTSVSSNRISLCISASVVLYASTMFWRWDDRFQLTLAYLVSRQASLQRASTNIWRWADKCELTVAYSCAFWHYTVLLQVLALCWQVSARINTSLCFSALHLASAGFWRWVDKCQLGPAYLCALRQVPYYILLHGFGVGLSNFSSLLHL